VVAQAQTWSGDPPTLPRYVLPIWIQVENHSGKALWCATAPFAWRSERTVKRRFLLVPPAR